MSVTRSRSDEDTLGGVVGGFAPLDSTLRIPSTYLPPAGFIGASVYKSSDQTNLPATTFTKVTYDTTRFDTDGFFSDANDRFTVPAGMGGKYLVTAVVDFYQNTSASTDVQADIYKNGSTYRQIWRGNLAANEYSSVSGSVVLDLAAGDYIEVFANPGSLNNTTDLRAGYNINAMEITKLDSGKVGAGIGAKAYNSAVQAIPDASDTVLTFDSEEFDTDGFHSTGSNTGRMTIPTGLGGKYLVTATTYGSAITGVLSLRKNGTTRLRGAYGRHGDAADQTISLYYTTVVELVAGDYVEVVLYQDSTGSGTQDFGHASAPEAQSSLSIMRLDSGASGRPSGTSMPSPVTGATIFRTDLGMEFYYDGTRWLCTCPHVLSFDWDAALPYSSATGGARIAHPGSSLGLSIWVEKMWVASYVVTTNDGTRYWTVSWDSSSPTVSVSTQSNAPDTVVIETATANQVASIAGTPWLSLALARVGSTPGAIYPPTNMSYRFIGT